MFPKNDPVNKFIDVPENLDVFFMKYVGSQTKENYSNIKNVSYFFYFRLKYVIKVFFNFKNMKYTERKMY